jgi:hypothetical protein
VASVFQAWLESLRANAPALVDVRQLGGGKTRLVPRYVVNGFNCRGQGLLCYAHGMAGFAIKGATANPPLDHDSLAFGFCHYTATPRADNLGRNGRHENLCFIDHEGVFQSFEQGDGEENEFEPLETGSITFLFMQ